MPQQISMPISDPIKRAEYNREYQKKNRERLYKKHREWVEKNREKQIAYHKEYNREWYKKNKEEHDARGKVWGQKPENKKKRVQYVQKYVSKHKEQVRENGLRYNQTTKGRFRFVQNNATKRKKDFTLSIEEYTNIVSRPCAYCGDVGKVGVDRIDNSIGYTKENSTSCCKMCNYMKNKHSVMDFLSHIKKIYLHNKLS